MDKSLRMLEYRCNRIRELVFFIMVGFFGYIIRKRIFFYYFFLFKYFWGMKLLGKLFCEFVLFEIKLNNIFLGNNK